MGSPICHVDDDNCSGVAAMMFSHPKAAPFMSNSGGGGHEKHDHEILFYKLPDLTNPIARCGSDVWEQDKKTHPEPQPWFHPFTRDMLQVAQIVEIKHFPRNIVQGNMRVIIVIAFGRRAHSATANSQALKVWSMLKVIELWLPTFPMSVLSQKTSNQYSNFCPEIKQVRDCVRISPSDVVNYESLEPRQNQITMHGRIVKLYSVQEPSRHPNTVLGRAQESVHMDVDTGTVDCIAIFGIQDSDIASAMVIKKVLFRDRDENSSFAKRAYSNLAFSQGVRRMTLFPERSGYEHLLVLFNPHGRLATIVDWINDKEIPSLYMLDDTWPQRVDLALALKRPIGRHSVGNSRVLSPNFPHNRVYYWGVQVSPALDIAFTDHLDINNNTSDKSKQSQTFRIVTMAGGGKGWDSCCWKISGDNQNCSSAARTAMPTCPSDRPVPTSPLKIDQRIPKTQFPQPMTTPFISRDGAFYTYPPSNINSFSVPFTQQAIPTRHGRSSTDPW